MKKLLNYFMQGLLYTVPISVTIYILFEAFLIIDGIIQSKYPGLGILIVISLITLIGFLGTTFIAKPITAYLNKFIKKAPLIKIVYTSVKDLMQAFVGKRKKFTEPVLVKMNEFGLERIGFITNKNLSSLNISNEKIAVYLPYSYGLMGTLLIVNKKNITPLDTSSTETMKFIISGGVTSIEKKDNGEESL